MPDQVILGIPFKVARGLGWLNWQAPTPEFSARMNLKVGEKGWTIQWEEQQYRGTLETAFLSSPNRSKVMSGSMGPAATAEEVVLQSYLTRGLKTPPWPAGQPVEGGQLWRIGQTFYMADAPQFWAIHKEDGWWGDCGRWRPYETLGGYLAQALRPSRSDQQVISQWLALGPRVREIEARRRLADLWADRPDPS